MAVAGERWISIGCEVDNMMYFGDIDSVGLVLHGQVYRGCTGASGFLGCF